MSIYAYVGLPGSGKSYDVVANQIMPALKAGRVVVTNVPLRMDAVLAKVPGADVREFPTEQVRGSPEMIDTYAVAGCVLVLDEVWKLFPAGLKVDRVPEPYKKLLAEHRHMVDAAGNSMQIVLVTQDLAQISAFAKQLVEQTFNHTKLTHVGLGGSYRIDVYHGARTADKMSKESRLQEVFGQYRQEVFDLYNSHTMRQAEGTGANEKSVDKRGNIWRRPGLLISGGLCVAAIAWAVPTLGEMFSGEDDTKTVVAVASGRTTMRSQAAAAASTAPVQWRVSGFVDRGEESVAFLASTDGQVAMMDARECQRSKYISQCKYQGQWVPLKSLPRTPVEDKRGLELPFGRTQESAK